MSGNKLHERRNIIIRAKDTNAAVNWAQREEISLLFCIDYEWRCEMMSAKWKINKCARERERRLCEIAAISRPTL